MYAFDKPHAPGQTLNKTFEVGYAQGIKTPAGIDRTVHEAGLLGRHVGERARNSLRRGRHLTLAWQPRRDSEAGKPYAVGIVDEHIFRLDILMYESVPMNLSECFRQAHGNAQGAPRIERLFVA